jgi:hypothetical protein
MTNFLKFLQSECASIDAFIGEFDDSKVSDEDVKIKIAAHVSYCSELEDYLKIEVDIDFNRLDDMNFSHITKDVTERNNLQGSKINLLWSKPLRLAIIDHLITMDINIPLLVDVVENYRFDAEIQELVEIVRSLDILGAEKRLLEYEGLLYMKLKEIERNTVEWERICGERLPVSFSDHKKVFSPYTTVSEIIGRIGSQRLIKYFSDKNHLLEPNVIFIELYASNHLSTAQWFNSFGEVNMSSLYDEVFRDVCRKGYLSFAQWLYSFEEFTMLVKYDDAFRGACNGDHIPMIEW